MNKGTVQIIYEDNHLIAVNKPAGMLTQGDETGDESLMDWVKSYIKIQKEKPGEVFLGLVHRLDRPVSGIVLFARTSKALVRMNEAFADRSIQKTYFALTKKKPEPLEGTLSHYLLKDHNKNTTKAYDQLSNRSKDAKLSILDYKLIGEIEGYCLIMIHPLTGRPHQIRVQLSKIGIPIVGDVKYGYKQALPDQNIALHAYQLEFDHPVTKNRIIISADIPVKGLWAKFQYILP